MQGLGSWNQFLKISNYLKTLSTSFPGAQSASLSTLNSLQDMKKSAAAQGSVSAEADGKCPWQAPVCSRQGQLPLLIFTTLAVGFQPPDWEKLKPHEEAVHRCSGQQTPLSFQLTTSINTRHASVPSWMSSPAEPWNNCSPHHADHSCMKQPI